MKVNSSTERRVLFSIWSPHQTDDPKTIPHDEKIKLLKKGNKVHTGKQKYLFSLGNDVIQRIGEGVWFISISKWRVELVKIHKMDGWMYG